VGGPVRYRLTRSQLLRRAGGGGLVFLALGFFEITSGLSRPYAGWALVEYSAFLVLIMLLGLSWSRRSGLELTEEYAVLYGHGLRRTRIRWADVQDLRGDRSGRTTAIILCEANGRARRLHAPTTGLRHPDPGFVEKYREIFEWWITHR